MNALTLQLIDSGLAAHAEAVASLALPAVQLLASDAEVDAAAVGVSRLGGVPDAPRKFEWPVWRDLPLAFLGQVALAGAAELVPDVLPPSGMLSFFYHPEQTVWGFDPGDRGSSRVYWFPDVGDLAPAQVPKALPEHGRFQPMAITLRLSRSLPPYQALDVCALRLSGEEEDAYFAFWEEWQGLYGAAPQHQLLGHPSPIQDEMQLECQLVSGGINCGSPVGYHDPRCAELEPGARDWRLLAQFDSDDRVGMMWGDVGMLYFWIRESDLAERRFDQAWMILQCS